MDITARIKELADARGWSDYRLCKVSGVPNATISNILHKNAIPSFPTLELICAAFDMTLAEFFLPAESELKLLNKSDLELLEQWSSLADYQKNAVVYSYTIILSLKRHSNRVAFFVLSSQRRSTICFKYDL